MTIDEQLQFSVLSAPVASLDRRTLSQAWYSALYGAGERSRVAGRASALETARGHNACPKPPALAQANGLRTSPRSQTPLRAPTGASAGVPPECERRAPHSILARKIERTFLQPKNPARKASFSLEGEHGRVHVILQSHGSRTKLVAVCSPGARAHVAQALAHARYALALRGVELEPDVREMPAC